jgi:hypothetical protein
MPPGTKADTEVVSVNQSPQEVKSTFVIGLPRSGTTLLASLLGAEDGVLSLSEPFLSRTISRHRLLYPIYFPKIRKSRITPPRDSDEMGFLTYLKNFSSDLGFSSLIVKETYRINPYFENDQLLSRIASAGEQVVAITRHPYDTAISTIRLFRQWRSVLGKLMRIVVTGLPVFNQDRDAVEWVASNWLSFTQWCQQTQPYTVSYENLVKYPDCYLQEISDRYHIPFCRKMPDDNHSRTIFGVSGDAAALSKRNQKLLIRPVGRRDRLKSEFLDIINATCGKAAEELGYPL